MRNRVTHLIAIMLLTAVFSAVRAQPGGKPFMGVTVDTVTTPLRKQYKLKANQGLLVLKVFPNSSAQAAGIRVNDVIVQLDDSTIRATPQFVALVQRHKAGDTVQLTLYRDGKKKVQPVLLKPRTGGVELP
jgi:S1-C subfamily serine protease